MKKFLLLILALCLALTCASALADGGSSHEDARNDQYYPAGPEQHRHIYDVYIVYTDASGAPTGQENFDRTEDVKEAHSFANGVCSLCGFTCNHSYNDGACRYCGAACPHANVFKEGEEWANLQVTPLDAEVHTLTFRQFDHYVCNDCGVTVRRDDMGMREGTEPHSFNNGVCDACGYVCSHSYTNGVCIYCGLACAHANVEKEGEEQADLQVEQLNADAHKLTYRQIDHYVCKDCGVTVEKRDMGMVEGQEAHSFSDGVCTKCGYVYVAPVQDDPTPYIPVYYEEPVTAAPTATPRPRARNTNAAPATPAPTQAPVAVDEQASVSTGANAETRAMAQEIRALVSGGAAVTDYFPAEVQAAIAEGFSSDIAGRDIALDSLMQVSVSGFASLTDDFDVFAITFALDKAYSAADAICPVIGLVSADGSVEWVVVEYEVLPDGTVQLNIPAALMVRMEAAASLRLAVLRAD